MFHRLRSRIPHASRPRMVMLSCCLLLLLGSSLALTNFFHQHTAAHAVPPPSVSKTWYFAEGRVGAGFQEYLTLSNPDPTIDCPATITYLPEGTVYTSYARKPLQVMSITIPHASRYTDSANQDLGITQMQNQGELFSAEVTVPDSSSCQGLVVERPMYFSFRGVTSGSDVVGATSPSVTNYFANIPVGMGTSTFLSILNPSASVPATLTASYYARGSLVGTQTLTVAANARGTLTPSDPALHLPAQTSAVIVSDQPVVVERSVYRTQVSEGVVGMVSSASAVVGMPALSDHWLFAEGHTSTTSQEYLLVSNISATSTMATIVLEYQNTHHQTLTVPVAAFSQVAIDVNQANDNPTGPCDVSPCSTTPEVSADVTAPSPSLLVERQMFFRYTHTLPGTSITVSATGGNEVVGAMGAMTSTANFAEGYTNTGYNEWLTLQNPTGSTETLVVTLRNEYGRTYTQNITVPAQNRATVDITNVVRLNLLQSGDDYRAYQVSMSVQSQGDVDFVAERPMYFHQSSYGIQGGTDVVGFAGSLSISSPTPTPTLSPTSTPSPTPTVGPMYTCTEINATLTGGTDIYFMAPGSDGNIWFTEYSHNLVGKITPAGTVTEYTVPTTSSRPEGITQGPDGNIWFTENGAGKIGMITSNGTFTEFALPSANSLPEGIVAGPDGNLWFVEEGTNKIGKITTVGVVTEYSVPTAGAYLNFLTTGPDGNIWFTEYSGNKIGRITPTGTITEFPTSTSGPIGITASSDGNVWFTELTTGKIGSITPSGTITEYSQGLTSGNGAFEITQGYDTNLWFTERSASQIGVITTSGVVTEVSTGTNTEPEAIALGPDHNIWFSDLRTGQLGKCVINH